MPFAAPVVNPIHQAFDQKDAEPARGPFVDPGLDVGGVGGQRVESGAGIDDLGFELSAIADHAEHDLAAGSMLEDVGDQLLQGKDKRVADVGTEAILL